jgi:hypothetical protein
MGEFILFADGRPVSAVAAEQVPDLEPLFGLRGILLVPTGCSGVITGRGPGCSLSLPPVALDQMELF